MNETFIFFQIQGVLKKYQAWNCIYQDTNEKWMKRIFSWGSDAQRYVKELPISVNIYVMSWYLCSLRIVDYYIYLCWYTNNVSSAVLSNFLNVTSRNSKLNPLFETRE